MFYPSSVWYPLKGHTYLNKPAAESQALIGYSQKLVGASNFLYVLYLVQKMTLCKKCKN